MLLKHRKLLRSIDAARVRQAIAEAEAETSGQIRVAVSPYFWGNVQRTAERAFRRLGMTATRQRNGILIFIVPGRRRFAVIGDEGIHAKVGDEFWQDVTAAIADCFRKGDFTGGLVHGIETVGRELATHFPADPAGPAHELPDDIYFGR